MSLGMKLWIAAIVAMSAVGQDATYMDGAARDLIERGRAAILRDAAVQNLRSLLFKGRVLRATERGDTVDGTVEIKILLPDRYLRIDVIDSAERRSGFAGARVLTPKGNLAREQAQFARFMLGALVYAPSQPRLRLQSTGESAFADTEAVDVSGPAFSARLVFDASTHVPLRLVFFGERQVSIVLSFANRRPVSGLDLPFRVTTQTPDRVLETLMFDEILVNPELPESEFRP
jgi:hypothetical protein